MKRVSEALVGASVLMAILLVVAGTIWLSQARFGGNDFTRDVRVRSIGGLLPGDPVLLRGVRIGRVDQIALSRSDWVTVSLRLNGSTVLPKNPVALFASTTLFGDWGVQVISRDNLPDDPEIRKAIAEATPARGNVMPGAALPDVGQLTAQAGRIAGDIAVISERVSSAFDSSSSVRLKNAFADLARLSSVLRTIAQGQESTLTRIGGSLDTGTTLLAATARSIARTASRVDSATSRDQLQRILGHTDTVTANLSDVASNLRTLARSAAGQQQAFERIVARTDSMLQRIQAGEGTLGRLSRDTTLYSEALGTVRTLRELLADIQRNPRRYFSFSVF
ncbi:MAG TPA: MlaD family protein [Candidatus Sulfotelmatobacter sp.]|nr:MlaD family protein [Candidatus Sulfotelmatobacter sp.]HXY70701.1 MlaD family protein [Gemmatimonadales bacterium]